MKNNKRKKWEPIYKSVNSERGTTKKQNQFIRFPTRLAYNIYSDNTLPLDFRIFMKVTRDTFGFPDRSGEPNEVYDKRQEWVTYRSLGYLAELLFGDSSDTNKKRIGRSIERLKTFGLLDVEHKDKKHSMNIKIHERLLVVDNNDGMEAGEEVEEEATVNSWGLSEQEESEEDIIKELRSEGKILNNCLKSNNNFTDFRSLKEYFDSGNLPSDFLEDLVRYSRPVLSCYHRLKNIRDLSEKNEKKKKLIEAFRDLALDKLEEIDHYKYWHGFERTSDFLDRKGVWNKS